MGTEDSPEPKFKPRFREAENCREPLKNLPRCLFTISRKWVRERGKRFPGLSGGNRSFPCALLMWRYLRFPGTLVRVKTPGR